MPVKRNLLIRKKKEISLLVLIVFLSLLLVFQIKSLLTPETVEKIKPFTIQILFWILIGTMGIIILSIPYLYWKKRKKAEQRLSTFQLIDYSTGNPINDYVDSIGYSGDISLWVPDNEFLTEKFINEQIESLKMDQEASTYKIRRHQQKIIEIKNQIKELKEKKEKLNEKMEKKEVKDKSEKMDCPECGQLNIEFSDKFNKIVKCENCGIYFNAVR